MQSQTSKTVLAIAITAIIVGGGVYLWQKNQSVYPLQQTATPTQKESAEPISYSMSGVSASVSKTTTAFNYTAEQLKGMAEECGSQHSTGYFDQLISKFRGTTKTIYNFKYTGESQESDTFMVTLLPNKAGYTSLDQFKKDFDICAAGGDAYPTMLNGNWLLLVNSCGSGFSDGSGRPIGCEKMQEVVQPTLKLN